MRFIPLACGALALITGLLTGLARLGLQMPELAVTLAEYHSGLMIGGFLGTLISLERAVAIGRWWTYTAPALSAAGALALVAGFPLLAAGAFLVAGVMLSIASAALALRHRALATAILAAAAVCWTVGTGAWLAGYTMPSVAGWWLNFLVLTIAAERLELSRLSAPGAAMQFLFVAACLLVVAGAARNELANDAAPLTGAGLIIMTAWLLRYDIAVRTIRTSGTARFSAACMLAGYVWLVTAGLLLLITPPAAATFSYDAAIHAIAIGFVLSMIFGHAPIIFPAVTGLPVRSSIAGYVPLALLHASIGLRIVADLTEWQEGREASGLATVAAIVLYALVIVASSLKRERRPIGHGAF
jgi:heme/copper-type cytochrome/quinol oxidase subunit 4